MRRHDAMTADPALMDEPETLLDAIRAARQGDSRAFEQIMLATERRVASLSWHILGDAEEVKEAIQETFLRLFRSLRRYDERRDFFAWLYTITVNVCRDLDRRRRRWQLFRPIEHASEVASDSRADDNLLRRDDVALLMRAIDALPPKQRVAVILRDIEELPTEKVAEILGSTPATVRVQISKARAKMREWMAGQ